MDIDDDAFVWKPISESGGNVNPTHRAFFNPSTRDSTFQISN
jgi:hypothetical protein